MNPFDDKVVEILLTMNAEKREELFALFALVVPVKHVLRLRRLLAAAVASRN